MFVVCIWLLFLQRRQGGAMLDWPQPAAKLHPATCSPTGERIGGPVARKLITKELSEWKEKKGGDAKAVIRHLPQIDHRPTMAISQTYTPQPALFYCWLGGYMAQNTPLFSLGQLSLPFL